MPRSYPKHTNPRVWVFAAALASFAVSTAVAQIPPEAIAQLQSVVGSRIEASTILAGDYAAAGGIYSFRGGNLADVSISKIGGGGEVAAPRPLGWGDLKWAPVLQGNVGLIDARNEFNTGYLQGNGSSYRTLAVTGGAGTRIYFTEKLSLAVTLSGIYGHVENDFEPRNPAGDLIESEGNGSLVNWTMETWSVVPAAGIRYQQPWGRALFECTSRGSYFHTESFSGTSDLLGVDGDSYTWENKLDLDLPLGLKVSSWELHTGGFFSRTDLFGNAAKGVHSEYFYTFNSRLVFDCLGHLWKVHWLGLGISYIWGHNFGGWSAGLDMRLKF
jgi:hypothetical protein